MDEQIRAERPIGYLVHEVARMFRRRFEEEARAHGLTLPQWRALVVIQQYEAITQVALAGYIDTDPMTISGILDRLKKRGLIERVAHPNDSRAKLSRLTAEGEALVVTARNVGAELYKTALIGVPEADVPVLIAGLTRIRDNLNNFDQVAAKQEEAV